MKDFILEIFTKLDGLVESFMKPIFDAISSFLASFFSKEGQGAYIVLLLMGLFLGILIIIGLFKLMKKFGLFLFLFVITVGISLLWIFLI